MNTRIAPKREEIELGELKPGDVFVPSDYEDDGYVYVVANPRSADIYMDFEVGDVVAICLNDGEINTFNPKAPVYVVKGSFTGEY